LLHRISEFGIKIGSSIFPLQHPLYEPTKIDVRIAAIREAMKFAYSIKSKTLCIRVGQIPKEPDSTERKLLLEALNDLARYSSHVGTVLAISQTSDTADTLKTLLDEIKVGPVGIDFDPAQFAMSGHPVADGLKTLHNYIMHVQLRDGIRGVEGGQETAVGRGNVDWIEVLALLGEIDYHGWLTAIRNDGDDRVAETSRGIKFVQKLMLGG
jgi:sugar phosphate isomerase/epimerase